MNELYEIIKAKYDEIENLRKELNDVEEKSENARKEYEASKLELDKFSDKQSGFYKDRLAIVEEKDAQFRKIDAERMLKDREFSLAFEEKKNEILSLIQTKKEYIDENRNVDIEKLNSTDFTGLTEEEIKEQKAKLEEEIILNNTTKEEFLKLPDTDKAKVRKAKENYLNNKNKLNELNEDAKKLELKRLYDFLNGRKPIDRFLELEELENKINDNFNIKNISQIGEMVNDFSNEKPEVEEPEIEELEIEEPEIEEPEVEEPDIEEPEVEEPEENMSAKEKHEKMLELSGVKFGVNKEKEGWTKPSIKTQEPKQNKIDPLVKDLNTNSTVKKLNKVELKPEQKYKLDRLKQNEKEEEILKEKTKQLGIVIEFNAKENNYTYSYVKDGKVISETIDGDDKKDISYIYNNFKNCDYYKKYYDKTIDEFVEDNTSKEIIEILYNLEKEFDMPLVDDYLQQIEKANDIYAGEYNMGLSDEIKFIFNMKGVYANKDNSFSKCRKLMLMANSHKGKFDFNFKNTKVIKGFTRITEFLDNHTSIIKRYKNIQEKALLKANNRAEIAEKSIVEEEKGETEESKQEMMNDKKSFLSRIKYIKQKRNVKNKPQTRENTKFRPLKKIKDYIKGTEFEENTTVKEESNDEKVH